MKRVTLFFIRLYQKTISFDHGLLKTLYPNGFCRYYPTCSEYAVKAINKKGFFIGSFYTMYRLLRCNPFSNGGVDDLSN